MTENSKLSRRAFFAAGGLAAVAAIAPIRGAAALPVRLVRLERSRFAHWRPHIGKEFRALHASGELKLTLREARRVRIVGEWPYNMRKPFRLIFDVSIDSATGTDGIYWVENVEIGRGSLFLMTCDDTRCGFQMRAEFA